MKKKNVISFRLPILAAILLSALAIQEQAQAQETLTFRYAPCARQFSAAYGHNASALQTLDSLMRYFRKGEEVLMIDTYSGDCTDILTAFHRSRDLKHRFARRYRLQETDFRLLKHLYPHPQEGDVVKVSLVPGSQRLPLLTGETEQKADRDTAIVLDLHYSPDFRDTSFVTTPAPVRRETIRRYLALKTNLAGWGLALANLAVEVEAGRHFTVELPLYYSGWDTGNRHALRGFLVQPEGRYWLTEAGSGHFFGLHAHAGWFNLKWGRNRYQYAGRPALGAGISYGYLLNFARHWGAEFTLGAGYANLRYDTYYNIPEGARIDTRTRHFFGITRVGISLVYHFNRSDR